MMISESCMILYGCVICFYLFATIFRTSSSFWVWTKSVIQHHNPHTSFHLWLQLIFILTLLINLGLVLCIMYQLFRWLEFDIFLFCYYYRRCICRLWVGKQMKRVWLRDRTRYIYLYHCLNFACSGWNSISSYSGKCYRKTQYGTRKNFHSRYCYQKSSSRNLQTSVSWWKANNFFSENRYVWMSSNYWLIFNMSSSRACHHKCFLVE